MRTKPKLSARKSTLAHIRPVVLRVAKAHWARNIRVFGSFARGQQRRDSDIDLLVTLPKHASLLDLAGLKVDLEEALHRKVDVLTDGGISPYLRDRIFREATPL